MREAKLVIIAMTILVFGVSATRVFANDETRKIEDCLEVIKAVKAIPEVGIPPVLLKNAQGIMIIPGVIKVGFVVGGRYGTGILTVRDEKGHWTAPVFVKIAGGSFGWQIGAQSTDLILVFKTKKSVNGILNGKLTIGADASVAAGPVGRSAEGATDVTLKSEIYSYSRSRGLFAGISLDGAALMMDDAADASFYGDNNLDARKILAGEGGGSGRHRSRNYCSCWSKSAADLERESLSVPFRHGSGHGSGHGGGLALSWGDVFSRYSSTTITDNTKPSARMGRKAYRVSRRQPGRRSYRRSITWAPAFLRPEGGERHH